MRTITPITEFRLYDTVRINAPSSRKYNGITGEIIAMTPKAFRIKIDETKVLTVNPAALERLEEVETGPNGDVVAGCLK